MARFPLRPPPRLPRRNNFVLAIAITLGLAAVYAYKERLIPAQQLSGRPFAIDGDTIGIAGTHIRLEGIDAPEAEQTCTDAGGRTTTCGMNATGALRERLAGRDVTCRSSGTDRYRRVLAVCRLPDGTDINAWLVREGWAIPFGTSGRYEAERDDARNARRGLWAGKFETPSQWRAAHKRETAE